MITIRAIAVACALTAFVRAAPPLPDHAARMAAGLELFKASVRPILITHCVDCHGGKKTQGGLDLVTRETLLEGGEEGVAIVPGNASQSRLLKLVRHEEKPNMPKKKPRLSDDEIQQISLWIDAGAPYDRPLLDDALDPATRSVVDEKARQFWSFQPLKAITPPTPAESTWSSTPIDRFVLAKLEDNKLRPNASADRRTLIRRLTFDLTGLPPSPREIDAFLADPAPDAYERVVDRLLQSPHFGERWARHWLDLARFAESHGYEQDYDRPFAYHYRDFVIKALNEDLPFDTFVRWQLAGDEIDPDNPQAWFATGFLGAGTHATQITANQAEKERYDELDDKVATIGTAMLGLTIGCARCHDHKYDPIPTADYYRLLATFTTTVRSDYDVMLDPKEARETRAKWERERAVLAKAVSDCETQELPARFDTWLQSQPTLQEPAWLWLTLENFKVSGPYYGVTTSTALDDGSRLVSIAGGSPDTIKFTARTSSPKVESILIEALSDGSLPDRGPGWARNGGFSLTELKVTARRKEQEPITLGVATRRSVPDGEVAKELFPWTDEKRVGRDRAALFVLETPAVFDGETELDFTLKFTTDFDRNLIGRIRVSAGASSEPPASTDSVSALDQAKARECFTRPMSSWTAEDRSAVFRAFRTTDATWLTLNRALSSHARAEPKPAVAKAMVCTENLPAIRLHTQGPDFYESTYILKRGDLAQKQGEALPGYLQVLMRSSDGEKHWQSPPPPQSRTPQRRTAFARWLCDVEQGGGHLLARVIVNRLWQHHFGRGLVATPSDFGMTGAAPTHPELLDWLAQELIRNGWRLKPLHRLMVTSAVYRQDSTSDSARAAIDPDNRLLWHRSPRRLEAESIRDAMLASSGQLDPTLYGPGSRDEGMLRRSLYFFMKRSQMTPMLIQFDAPDSLQSSGQRVNTTVAPQALLLLNNPHVRAWAHAFAASLTPAASDHAAIEMAYTRALGRPPAAEELSAATEFLATQSSTYPTSDSRLRALADFCQTLFCLNEFVYIN